MHWIGVDFDGTLAEYDGTDWYNAGAPIVPMVERVKRWLADGLEVRIVTARVSKRNVAMNAQRAFDAGMTPRAFAEAPIRAFLREQGLDAITKITAEKDGAMLELWDDRAIEVYNGHPLSLHMLPRFDETKLYVWLQQALAQVGGIVDMGDDAWYYTLTPERVRDVATIIAARSAEEEGSIE